MTNEFWIVLSLIAVTAIASVWFGHEWGRQTECRNWTQEALDEFKRNYFAEFVKKFEQKVDEKSDEIAAEKISIFIESLPEEQQNWFKGFEIGEDDDEKGST